MARKPTETAIFSLRIREDLRKRIERAAEANKTSMNIEIIKRLEASFQKEDQDDLAGRMVARTIKILVENLDQPDPSTKGLLAAANKILKEEGK